MQKLEIEGSLYLLKRDVKPFYKIHILNRKSRKDFIDQLNEDT